MNTPIKDFTDNYAKSGIIRAHMPGHKGKFPLTEFDITEIKGADSLFEADGIIAESEKNTSEIFHSYKTLYSAGGSTLCIFTMLAMCLMNGKTAVWLPFATATGLFSMPACSLTQRWNGYIPNMKTPLFREKSLPKQWKGP